MKPTEQQIETLGSLDTLDLEQAARLMRLGRDAMKELVDNGEVAALSCNQKHAVLLRTDVLDYIRERGRKQAEERRSRASGKPKASAAPQGAGKQPTGPRTPALPDLDRYELTTADRRGSTPAGSRSA